MQITKQLLEDILDPQNFTWVKVHRYEPQAAEGIGFFQQDYWRLMEHHKKETEFLISLIQSLAKYGLERTLDVDKFEWPLSTLKDKPPIGGGL